MKFENCLFGILFNALSSGLNRMLGETFCFYVIRKSKIVLLLYKSNSTCVYTTDE